MSTREVTLDGGSPWGFRMHGGADVQQPLRISRVNPGSKAAQRGIREGDFISSINGQVTRGITNSEAHALLRNAGDTLTLGLNQEGTGSPKRRLQKIQHDSKEDAIKRTSITSTASIVSNLSTTNRVLTTFNQNNEIKNTNGISKRSETEQRKTQSTNNFTSYIKQGTPISSTSRGATTNVQSHDAPDDDTVTDCKRLVHNIHPVDCNEIAVDDSVIDSCCDKALLDVAIMADNVNGSSRSRKQRRSRTNRKKSKKCCSVTQSDSHETVTVTTTATTTATPIPTSSTIQQQCDNETIHVTDKNCDTINETSAESASETVVRETYRVESPTTVHREKKTNGMVKSRSLDDDEHVKITEITDESVHEKSTSLSESTAIVSEAESDVEWETVGELDIQKDTSQQRVGKLSVISLPLEEHRMFETSHISPEDERSLRDFLESLNLVCSPEESIKRLEKTAPDVKTRKAKKRAVIMQHFLPYYENPRYLDVISEEGSDLSDKDNKQATFKCHRVPTTDYFDDDDDVFETIDTKEKKLRNKFQTRITRLHDDAILVGTKLIDSSIPTSSHIVETATIKEATWTTSMTEVRSGAEVVYLEDSSSSMTPSDLLDQEDATCDLDADDEEDISMDLDRSITENLETSSSQTSFIQTESIPTLSDTVSRISPSTDTEQSNSIIQSDITEEKTQTGLVNGDKNTETLSFVSSSEKSLSIELSTNDENNPDKNVTDSALNEQQEEKTLTSDEKRDEILMEQDIKDKLICSDSEEQYTKELKTLCDGLNKQTSDENTNEIDSVNVSRSNSSNSVCSSKSTSQCTALYNPVHSSLTNLAAMLREDSFDEHVLNQPTSLRELCIKTLLTMPFGSDVMEELANVSLHIEKMTTQSPLPIQNAPADLKSNSFHDKSFETINKTNTDKSLVLLVDTPILNRQMEDEKWIGLPTEEDPNLLVCLSPSQKNFIDGTRSVPNEADNLLDLHRKYIERRGYHENFDLHPPTYNKNEPSMSLQFKFSQPTEHKHSNLPETNSRNNLLKIIRESSETSSDDDIKKIQSYKMNSLHNVNINYNDYIKQFVKEIPVHASTSQQVQNEEHKHKKCNNIKYDKYIKEITREVPIQVEKQMHKPVNNKIYSTAEIDINTNDNSRLKARQLNEWLNLARKSNDANSNISSNKLITQRSCEDYVCHSSGAKITSESSSRRYSLPFNLYEQQMQYILEKEREIQREIDKLTEEKLKLENDITETVKPDVGTLETSRKRNAFDAGKYRISRKGDIAILQTETEKQFHKPASSPSTEKFREEMYHEYMSKIAERQERKQNKVIKVKISTKLPTQQNDPTVLSPQCEVKHVCGIEDEFMSKVREKKNKLGVKEETSDEDKKKSVSDKEDDNEPVLVMDGSLLTDAKKLPKHLQEFVDYTRTDTAHDGIWTPGKTTENKPLVLSSDTEHRKSSPPKEVKNDEPAPVVWTPRSAGSSPTAERKEFRPVNFDSPVLSRKHKSKESTPVQTPESSISILPPWESSSRDSTQESLSTSQERRLTTSHSAPASGLNNLSKLPRAQNPTITLLQKAREGQLPRGASYIEQSQQVIQRQKIKDDRPPLIGPNEILYTVKNEYMSESSDSEKPKKMADLGSRKFEGIGPTTKDGMPLVLRSEVKDSNQTKWYKRMYDTLHRSRNDDEYVTVRYKTRRGRYPYTSAGGYLSEPEPLAYDSDVALTASKYATLDRRRFQQNRDKENEYITYTIPRNKYVSASVKHTTDVYKNQPGRIEDYVPGHSSISEKEAKEWWDEVMEIFDGWLDDHSALPSLNYMLSQVTARSHLEQQKHVPQNKSYMSHALKESGYESDSTLVFRRREDAALQLSPQEQKEAYKSIQRGGEVPLHGLRKPAPERPKDDSEIEYFPISPTLTRIRIHKNIKPDNEMFCYPITMHHQPSQVFSTYKRTAPSSVTIPQPPKLPLQPPSPPKRRSSRNSHTLRLISTMTIHTNSPKLSRRHETCFKSPTEKSNVKILRDRISCKLRSPTNAKKGVKVTKTISTYPSSSKESITTIVSSSKDSKGVTNKIKSKTDITCKKEKEHNQHYSRSTVASTARRCCRHCSFSAPPKITETAKLSEKIKSRGVSLDRTFGSEKRKVDLSLPKLPTDSRLRLVKSPDLVSPTEVKKGVLKQKDILNMEEKSYPPGTIVKKSTSLFSSAKNGLRSIHKPDEKSLNVTVAISARGKEIFNPSKIMSKSTKSPSPILQRSATTRNISSSPVPSNISEKSKSSQKSRTMSVESLPSTSTKRKNPLRPASISRIKSSRVSSGEDITTDREKKKTKKIKKDQSNEELKKEKRNHKRENKTKDTEKGKVKKCAGRAAGTEIVKKLKKMEDSEKKVQVIKAETIEERHRDIFQPYSFFQHLFLRDILSPPLPTTKHSYVMERTKMLQNNIFSSKRPETTVSAVKVYLTNRKPVSESKFKCMDREIMRSRSASPLALSRSYSGKRSRFDSISEVSNEDNYFDQRSLSQESLRSKRSSSLPTKIICSETSRSVSPACDKSLVKYSRKPPSPSPVRSPSRRRIHSTKSPASITVEGISGVRKKVVRARSAGEAEAMKREMYSSQMSLTPSVSSVSLSQITDPHEYKTYVTELLHSTKKCERFKELNNFYSSLERLSQLEYTTSSLDLRPRRRNEEEIIDYDRWMQVRTRERAEHELNILYKKLQQEQKEKDLLFRPKDVENFKWKYNREFGLKIKEKSVENIKEQFEKLKDAESPLEISRRRELDYQKDVYKPLWRGSSVRSLVTRIAERRSQSESRAITAKEYLSPERLLFKEVGSKLWSSLSVEQVNALKNQLAQIYSQAPSDKQDDYSIHVKPCTKTSPGDKLIIRRNSANELSSEKPKFKENKYVKSSSIGTIAGGHSISENEKKRLSLSLSQEVRDRLSQKQKKYKTSMSIVLGKETRGAIAAAEANVKSVPESTSPRTCYSLEPTEDDVGIKQKSEKDFLLVLTKDETEEQKQNVRQTLEEWAQPKAETSLVKRVSSTSETESASSDTSTKTAIFVGKRDDVHKKIEYFERGADTDTYVPTVHRPADDNEGIDTIPIKEEMSPKKSKNVSNLVTSQSYADLKELFGEQELMKFATIPLAATRKQHIPPRRPQFRMINISPLRTASEASSTESLFKPGSLSPNSEKYWNAYLALVKGVDVRKLAEKFENFKDFYSSDTYKPSHRRSKSDSELPLDRDGQRIGEVYWLKRKYENIGRGRSRTRREGKTSPIPKTPLRAEDRLMPHINIISKLASLYPKKSLTPEKQRSTEELAKDLGCPIGEVEKLREKFDSPDREEKVSLLGQMYTSSPNIHELRDIAPYLAGSWIAHKYPRYQDNTRSLSAPEESATGKTLVKKDQQRTKSLSPPRSSKQPSSILKTHHYHHPRKDIFMNQFYDPSIHRPAYRYQPASPNVDRGRTRSWSPTTRHTVKFKEPVLGPVPPPKGRHYNRIMGPESPRKYVEDEVTIHYRSPVRHEIKETLSEEELARRQAEAMRRIYQEERRRKYLQELQDMNSRRHTDNFIPSQKSPIPLNRYDDFIDDLSVKIKPRERSPEPRIVARALYNFVGQSSRELTFRKGDIIFIRRQVDKNWFEGEHNAMVGLFPSNYVEIIPYDGIKATPRKAHEGQARAKFNFIAQTHLELSLAKGELVVLTRRVDDNWYEGRIGSRKGIFPVSYVEVLIDPSDKPEVTTSNKPVASPAAHSLLLNGSSGGKESMGSHHYQPTYAAQQTTSSFHAKPVNVIGTATYTSSTRTQKQITPAVNEALHIDTHSEPVPYRALYKYRPQNDDELELQEGDTVYVLEKCDDGWYVGSSQRTGAFGTFPGNYVERI